jgi:hypothetical protein
VRFFFRHGKDDGVTHRVKGSREFLAGFCIVFGTTLFDGDEHEDCVNEYHGLDVSVNDDVPISIDDLCADRHLVTIKSQTEEEMQKFLAESDGDFVGWFKQTLLDDMEVEHPYTCVLIGHNKHIHLTQFEDEDFVKGVAEACRLVGIEPGAKIQRIHCGEIPTDLETFL